jgi:hypothetical protein
MSEPIDPIAEAIERWADVDWELRTQSQGERITGAQLINETGDILIDLDEPFVGELNVLQLAAAAPTDIRALMGLIERQHTALTEFYTMLLDILAALKAGAEELDLDPYVLRAAAAMRGDAPPPPPPRSTTPEQAGEQARKAMAIAAHLDQLFGRDPTTGLADEADRAFDNPPRNYDR